MQWTSVYRFIVNIQNSALVDVNNINNGTLTTAGLSIYDGRVKINYGGYYIVGKRCYVQIHLGLLIDLAQSNFFALLKSFPVPKGAFSVALNGAVLLKNGAISAFLDENGTLHINTSTNVITKTSNILISGSYLIN